jgi:hypothetical protein
VKDVTRILGAIERGEPKAADELLPLVYEELRKLAAQKMTGDQGVGGLQFLPPDGNTLVSLSDDEVRLWRAPSWAEITAAEAKEKKEPRLP